VGDIADYQTTRMAVPTACETRWTNILASLERHRDAIIARHTDGKEETGLVHTALIIVELVRTSPSVNGNGAVWMKLADKAEAEECCVSITKARRYMQAYSTFTRKFIEK
jgi:hypothetical protein